MYRFCVAKQYVVLKETMIRNLEDTGAMFDEAKDGQEAVKLCSQHKYDLILMDLHMPCMDGYAATKHIRASTQPWAKTVPIISVSAESSSELHAKCLEAGINDHHAKPVQLETLLGMIVRWMHR